MARAQYFVVRHEGEWKIKLGRKYFGWRYYGPYLTQGDAIHAAVEAAYHAGRKSGASEVLIQDDDKSFRSEWIYGLDPYPLRG